MKIINASKIEEITKLARKNGYQCEEMIHFDRIVEDPVIISNHSDPRGEVANTLAVNNTPVLYLAFKAPLNLSSKIHVLQGEFITWSQIDNWLANVREQLLQQRDYATLKIKKTISVQGIRPGVGASFVARTLAIESAKKRRTLLIDANYRYPSVPYILGYYDSRLTLDACLVKLLDNEEVNVMDYCLNSQRIENATAKQKKFFKQLPINLYTLTPDTEKGIEFFPELPSDINEATGCIKTLLDSAKAHFDCIIACISSDIDELFNLALLGATDNHYMVTDTNPSSVAIFKSRMETIGNCGILTDNYKVIMNKLFENASTESFEKVLGRKIDLSIPYDREMLVKLSRLDLANSEGVQKAIESLENVTFGGDKPEVKENERKGFRFRLSKVSSY